MLTNRRTFLAATGISALASGLQAQEDKPIRLAIIGAGHRAWAHLAILESLPGFRVVALADPTPENLDRASTLAPGAATYADYRKLLAERQDLDAVVVITPSFLHAEVTVAALRRGLPVLCEKPIATTVEDANRMIEASRQAGKLLYIGFQKRLVPTTSKMQQLAASGAIGKLELVSGNLFRGDWKPESWKYTDPRTGVKTNWRFLTYCEGSALLEDGVHEIDTANWIIHDRPVRVMATGGNNILKNRETADHVATIVEYEGGAKLSFELCLFAPHAGPQSRRLVLIGSEGTMYAENGKVAIRRRDNGALRYEEAAEDTPRAATARQIGSAQDPETYHQYLRFAEALRPGSAIPADLEGAKATAKIVLLAEKSWREHRVMNWSDLPA